MFETLKHNSHITKIFVWIYNNSPIKSLFDSHVLFDRQNRWSSQNDKTVVKIHWRLTKSTGNIKKVSICLCGYFYYIFRHSMYIFNISLVIKTKINIKFRFFYKNFQNTLWQILSVAFVQRETKNLTTCFHLELAQTCKTYKPFIESRKLKVFTGRRTISLSRNVEVPLKEVGLIEVSL